MSTIKRLTEVIEILESAFEDKKPFYEVTIIGKDGERRELESREQHLESLIDIALQILDDVQERETIKSNFKLIVKNH
jgi:hypothetical protein